MPDPDPVERERRDLQNMAVDLAYRLQILASRLRELKAKEEGR